MTLRLHAQFGYPSYGQSGTDWEQPEFDAYKYIQALKGNAVNGYATIRHPDGRWVRIEGENTKPAFDVFGAWAGKGLASLPTKTGFLVPIPSSSSLEFGADAKGQALVAAIALHNPGYTPFEGLCWRKNLGKASAGAGTRDPNLLLPNLRVRTPLPAGQYVLVDDVLTTGGHAIACARALRAAGADVRHCVVAGRTVLDRPAAGVLSLIQEDLE